MSNKLVKENETKRTVDSQQISVYLKILFAIFNISLLVALLVLGAFIYADVHVMKSVFVLNKEAIQEVAPKNASASDTTVNVDGVDYDISSNSVEPSDATSNKGEIYSGNFAEELASNGLLLYEVENATQFMGDGYNGRIYTSETNTQLTVDVPTEVSIGENALDFRNPEEFQVLEGQFTKETDEYGDTYHLKNEDGSDYFFLRATKNTASNSNGETKDYDAFYVRLKDYEKCKGLGVGYGSLHIDSTIAEVIDAFGTPTYVDMYDNEDEAPYLMFYFAKSNEENSSIDEISIIFAEDENAPNGYYVSEITAAAF